MLLVAPLQEDCERRFRYTADGGIRPAVPSDRGATETCARLGLNSPRLRKLRAGAIDGAIHNLHDLTGQELARFAQTLLLKDSSGMFPEFCLQVVGVLQGLTPP